METKNRAVGPALIPAELGLFKTVEKLIKLFFLDGKKVFEIIRHGKLDGFVLSEELAFVSNDKDTLYLFHPILLKKFYLTSIPVKILFVGNEMKVDHFILHDPSLFLQKYLNLIKFWNCPIESESWEEIYDLFKFNPNRRFANVEYESAEIPKMWDGQKYSIITRDGDSYLAMVVLEDLLSENYQWQIFAKKKLINNNEVIAWKLFQPL